jgi:hypothetical protein
MMIGSKISPSGILIEPFWLIPVSCLFILIGIISLVVTTIFQNK